MGEFPGEFSRLSEYPLQGIRELQARRLAILALEVHEQLGQAGLRRGGITTQRGWRSLFARDEVQTLALRHPHSSTIRS